MSIPPWTTSGGVSLETRMYRLQYLILKFYAKGCTRSNTENFNFVIFFKLTPITSKFLKIFKAQILKFLKLHRSEEFFFMKSTRSFRSYFTLIWRSDSYYSKLLAFLTFSRSEESLCTKAFKIGDALNFDLFKLLQITILNRINPKTLSWYIIVKKIFHVKLYNTADRLISTT